MSSISLIASTCVCNERVIGSIMLDVFSNTTSPTIVADWEIELMRIFAFFLASVDCQLVICVRASKTNRSRLRKQTTDVWRSMNCVVLI